MTLQNFLTEKENTSFIYTFKEDNIGSTLEKKQEEMIGIVGLFVPNNVLYECNVHRLSIHKHYVANENLCNHVFVNGISVH